MKPPAPHLGVVRASVERRFSKERMVDEYLALYQRVTRVSIPCDN
jgi:hypothetical protein